jgi:hypothetical protein
LSVDGEKFKTLLGDMWQQVGLCKFILIKMKAAN